MNGVMRVLRDLVAAGCLVLASNAAVAQEVVRYVHTDALGSPVAESDEAGNVVVRYNYEPYGASLGDGPEDAPGFTGHVSDSSTGLVYMQQRYYDPELGVFLSVDPVTAFAEPVMQFNVYRYGNGNPYKFVDPDGEAGKVAWLVRLTATQTHKVARLTQEQAVRARRAQQNVIADRKQVANQIETAAHGTDGQLRHVGHEIDNGVKGLPHYQTEGARGHSFWGKVSVGALAMAGALDQLAEAAEYIPDLAPRPAEQADIARWNNAMEVISERSGISMPGVRVGQNGGFQGYFRVNGRIDSKRLEQRLKKEK